VCKGPQVDRRQPQCIMCVFITAVPDTKLLGPVRNPVLQHRGACFPWFLWFGNRTQNSRVAGARPNHQPIGDLEPTQGGAGTREEPGTSTQVAPCFRVHKLPRTRTLFRCPVPYKDAGADEPWPSTAGPWHARAAERGSRQEARPNRSTPGSRA
jgi:hypothetical protein